MELDEEIGRYVCTVCFAESTAASEVIQEYDEVMETRDVDVTLKRVELGG